MPVVVMPVRTRWVMEEVGRRWEKVGAWGKGDGPGAGVKRAVEMMAQPRHGDCLAFAHSVPQGRRGLPVSAPADKGLRRRPNDMVYTIVHDAVLRKEFTMATHTSHKRQRSHVEQPDDPEPGALPVEPDEGPVPASIPADPEHDRVVDPEA